MVTIEQFNGTGPCGRIPYGKEVSAWTMRTNGNMIIPLQDKNESGDTGYPNVGSSGMNTANQYNDPQPEPGAGCSPDSNGAGGATPPRYRPTAAGRAAPKKKKSSMARRVGTQRRGAGAGRSHGLCGRLCGAKYGGSSKVVIQQVAPSSSTAAPGSDSSITAAFSAAAA